MKKISYKKLIGYISAGVLVGATIGAGLYGAFSDPVIKEVTKTVYVDKEVVVEVPFNVTVVEEVEVDNGNLDLVTERLEDIGIYEDAAEVVEEIKAEDEALALALEVIEEDGADELEDAGEYDDEDELKLLQILGTYDDVVVTRSDFDRDEYTFEIEAKWYDDDSDDKDWFVFTVEVEDGEAKIVDIDN